MNNLDVDDNVGNSSMSAGVQTLQDENKQTLMRSQNCLIHLGVSRNYIILSASKTVINQERCCYGYLHA